MGIRNLIEGIKHKKQGVYPCFFVFYDKSITDMLKIYIFFHNVFKKCYKFDIINISIIRWIAQKWYKKEECKLATHSIPRNVKGER